MGILIMCRMYPQFWILDSCLCTVLVTLGVVVRVSSLFRRVRLVGGLIDSTLAGFIGCLLERRPLGVRLRVTCCLYQPSVVAEIACYGGP